MLLNELLSLLPHATGDGATVVALTGVTIGFCLWLIGARFSRHIIALLCVGIGAMLGMRAPALYGWNLSGAGVAVAGAIAAGVVGFLMHRLLIGVTLGGAMGLWASLATWILCRNGQSWTWPAIDADTTIRSYGIALWQAVPADVTKILPWSAGVAMLSGLALSIAAPKLAVTLNWSLIGTTLMLTMGLAAVQSSQPQWFYQIPSQLWVQLGSIIALVALGVLTQWRLVPKPRPSKQQKPQPAAT
jgi:hypothetical protein